MLREVALPQAYRTTPTGLYLISTAWQGKRNVQFAFRTLGISDDPPLLVIGIQDKNFSLELIQKSKEFVVNVCSQNQLHAVDRSRDLSGRNVEDKFVALGLDTLPANTCRRLWLRVAMPTWNAASLMKWRWRPVSILAKPSHPTLTIRSLQWDGWPGKLFGSMVQSSRLSVDGGEPCCNGFGPAYGCSRFH